MIDFKCYVCGKAFRVGDHLAGKSGKCKQCNSPIRIPDPAAAAAEPDDDLAVPDLSEVRPNQMFDLLSEADPLGPLEDLAADALEGFDGPAQPVRGYTYKMVQIPSNIQVMMGTSTKGVAAAYLEDVVNEHAADGWDFMRVDEIGVQVNPGCLWALLGVRSHRVGYSVVSFRRPVGG